MTIEARFLSNISTQNRPPNSRLPPNADSARSHHRLYHGLVYIYCYQSRHHQNLISILPLKGFHDEFHQTCVFKDVSS
jgi:hypothetical protein